MKKKLLSLALAAVMVMGMATTGLADTTYSNMETVTISKTYNLEGAGTSPGETFYLKQTAKETVDGEVADNDVPDLIKLTDEGKTNYVAEASFDEGAAGNSSDDIKIQEFTIGLPNYENVGIYKYTLEEVKGTTAGVEYYEEKIYLIVTVINDVTSGKIKVAAVHTETSWNGSANNEGKSDSISNTYSAGALNIKKEVEGNLGDTSKYFAVNVKLTGEDSEKKYADSYAISGGTYSDNPDTIVIGEETTIYLKDEETITIENLPYNVTYTIIESTDAAENDGYDAPAYSKGASDTEETFEFEQGNKTTSENVTTVSAGKTEGKIDDASDTIIIKNTKNGEVDTGVNLDTLPYIMILAIVLTGAACMVFRRRMSDKY